jgi:hypothetical protein
MHIFCVLLLRKYCDLVVIGPSGAVQTVSDNRRPLFSIFWSERSACDQRSALRWPLFWSERSAYDQRSALRWPLFWSERSAYDQRSALRWPLFSILFFCQAQSQLQL